MAEYDLTATNAMYLDRHLIVPLLDFLAGAGFHSEGDVLREKLSVLEGTGMADTYSDLHEAVHSSADPSRADRRAAVVSRLESLRAAVGPALELFRDGDRVRALQQEKLFHLSYLTQHHAVRPDEAVPQLLALARAEYDAGDYAGAAQLLHCARSLAGSNEAPGHATAQVADVQLAASWGRLAATTLARDWDQALREVERVRDGIEAAAQAQGRPAPRARVGGGDGAAEEEESAAERAARLAEEARRTAHPALAVERRAWLMHWSLFVFFNHPNGRAALVDLFLTDSYAAAIQQACPHLLRYLATAVVTESRRRQSLRDVVRMIGVEGIGHADPVTRFLDAIYVKFDFDDAQERLARCDAVLAADFFLVGLRTDFLDNARHLIFETYCRVHKRISIPMIGEKLSMGPGEAERWVVNLIRNARLDAKIDSQSNCVVMGSHEHNVYQQVVERTKGLSFRSATIGNYVSKRMAEVAALEAAAAQAQAQAAAQAPQEDQAVAVE